MSEKKSGRKATMVYVDEALKKRLKRSLFDVDHVKFRGKPADMSSLTMALWQWYLRMAPGQQSSFLEREFPELERSTSPVPVEGPDSDEPGHDPDQARKRKGRAS